MDTHEQALRWADQLTWGENLLEADPTAALDAHRGVTASIEAYLRDHPEARAELAQLLCRARIELTHSAEASARFNSAAAERERHFHARELADVRVPIAELRRPWPPRH